MNAPVDIRYAGVSVGRAEVVRPVEGRVGYLFLAVSAPLPVGTVIELGDATQRQGARVTRAIETGDATEIGIEIELGTGSVDLPADTGGVPEGFASEASGTVEPSGLTDTGDKKKKKKKR